MNSALLGFLGILNRAGKISFGEVIYSQLNKKKIYLIVYANNVKEGTLKKCLSKAKSSDVLCQEVSVSKEILGQALGYDEISLVAVLDKKAANNIVQKMKEGGPSGKKESIL